MIPWIIQMSIISLILIILVHYLFTFFMTNLTIPKVKDLVNKPQQQYETLYNTMKEQSVFKNKGSENENIKNENMKNENENMKNENMKNELKNYLKELSDNTSNNHNNSNNSSNNNSSNNNSNNSNVNNMGGLLTGETVSSGVFDSNSYCTF